MKKWTKVLSAFVVATVMSTGIAAITGCDSCGDDDKHEHNYATTWSSGADGHWHECLNDGCDEKQKDFAAHVDNKINGTETDGEDGLCDVCNYKIKDVTPEGKVTVTFNSNGGSAVPASTIDKGAKVTKPADPTKANNTFGGWYTDDGTFLNAFDFDEAVNASITVYAKWTSNSSVEQVTVTFNSNGGSTVPASTIDKGAKVTKPADPTKTNNTFGGWYTDDGTFLNAFDFDESVNESITVYAKWTENPPEQVTVTFVTGDGASTVDAQTIDKGGKATRPETNPTKPDVIFDNWYADEQYTTLFDFDAVINESTNVYAKWREVTLFDTLSARDDNLVSKDFAVYGTVDVHNGYGVAGVYESVKDATAISGGALSHVSGKGANTSIIVDFGTLAADSTVDGYMEVKVSATGSKWNLIRFIDGSGNAVLTIGVGTDKAKLAYVVGSSLTENNADVANIQKTAIDFKENTVYKISYQFNMQTGAVSLNINGTDITLADAGITDVVGVTLISGGSGARLVTLDNVAVCGTEMSVATLKEQKVADLNTEFAKYILEDSQDGTVKATHSINKADVIAAHDNGLAAIGSAETIEGVLKAYNGAVAAMKAVPSDVQQAAINFLEEQFPKADYTQNAEAYEAAIADILKETDPVKLALPTANEYDGFDFAAGSDTISKVYYAIRDISSDEECYQQHIGEKVCEELGIDMEDEESFMAFVNQYRINIMALAELMDEDGLTSREYYKACNEFDSYELAIAYADETFVPSFVAEANNIKKDETLIAEYAASKTEDINSYKTAEIAALTDEGTKTAIAEEKASALETLANGIKDADGAYAQVVDSSDPENLVYRYQQLIDEKVAAVKASIDLKIASDGKSVDEVKEIAAQSFADYKAEKLETVQDEAFKTELTSAANAPALDFTECGTIAAVYAELDGKKAEYDTWFAEQLANKEYTVTITGNGITDGVELKVKYGGKLDEREVFATDPTEGLANVMLDQSQGWILFIDEECTQVYDFNTAVYGATTLYVKTVPAITVESVTNTFSYAAIDTTEISKRPATGKDKNAPDTSPIYNSDFGGTVNSFLNIVNEEANLVTYRTSNSCIENRDAGLSVYFPQNGGTITIKFASTGSSNKSRLGLCYTEWEYDEKTGESHEVTKWIKANDGTTATLVTGDADEGAYEVSGTSVVEITFTVAQGGTYYISCPSGITTRGARIMAVKQVSNAYKEQAILVESVDILGNNSETGEEEIVTDKTVELIAGSDLWLNLSINNRQYSNYIEKIEWKSGDENKFTVTPENDGMYASLSGLAAGDATLTVTVTDKAGKTFTASVTITVKSQGVESIIIADTLIATVGNSESVEVSIYPENASNQEVIWEVTEGADVVSVENGLVTGLKEGTATIKVTSSDNSEVSATCTVTVINQAVESVSLNVSETTVSVGKTETLVATINPENASNKNVSWSSNNKSVATVENGVVTGVAEGTATITVTTEDGEHTATCTVTVSVLQKQKYEISAGTFATGTQIVNDGSLFDMSAATGLTAATLTDTNNFTFPDSTTQKGTSINALYMDSVIDKSGTSNPLSTDLITISAKSKIKVTIYVICNSGGSFGTARSCEFKVTDSVDGSSAVSIGSSNASAKRTVTELSFTVEAGHTVTLSASGANNNGAKVYIFGLSAENI